MKAKNTPSHQVYMVKGKDKHAHWSRIGAAWPHEDGEGFNIKLDAFPGDGKLVVRKIQPKEE